MSQAIFWKINIIILSWFAEFEGRIADINVIIIYILHTGKSLLSYLLCCLWLNFNAYWRHLLYSSKTKSISRLL